MAKLPLRSAAVAAVVSGGVPRAYLVTVIGQRERRDRSSAEPGMHSPKETLHRNDGRRPLDLLAGLPTWITVELIQRTIEVWQPFYQTSLSTEDAVAILLNVGQLFEVLNQRDGTD